MLNLAVAVPRKGESMKTASVVAALCLGASLLGRSALAADVSGGATIVPITGGLPAGSFDIKTDAASIFLERAVLFKENGWFTKDKEVAITAKMSINSRKRNSSSTTLTISRVYKFDVKTYDDGRVEIPIKSLPLLDTFNLSGEDYLVTSIVMDLFLSKKKEKTDFTKTLETVIEVSKRIPIPVNPYAEYASVFGDSFSQVVERAIQEGADTVPFASFGLRFLQGSTSAAYTEKPGVHAIVIAGKAQEPGVLPLEKLDGKSLAYDEIAGLSYAGNRVKNNHIIVRVTASTDPWKSLASSKDTLERLYAEGKGALAFSKAQGISAPNLAAIIKRQDASDTFTLSSAETVQFESAIKEFNNIRASSVFQF